MMPIDTPSTPAAEPSQFALLGQRRFAPFFWTQFLGAANDNLFKFAFTVLVTYQVQLAWLSPALAGLAIGALFILPFVLFSATAGQLADKLDKALLMRFVKSLEIGIMALAGWAFVQTDDQVRVVTLLACVFAMGLHSTLFGPVKFAYLPQHLSERELTGGNGMVEMGTFVAILLGNVAGGLLIALPDGGALAVGLCCLAVALLGRWTAQRVPATPAPMPDLRIEWNPWRETWRNLRLAREDRLLWHTLLAISWMWFYGAVFLAQFPAFAKEVLHGDEQVALMLLVIFSLGLGLGSLACERLSRGRVEIGLTPLGAMAMTVFAIDLFFACAQVQAPVQGLWTASDFLQQPAHGRVVIDLLGLSVGAGVYSVPMYALFQWRGPTTHVSRLVAANNILNALYMVVSSLLAGALLALGLDTADLFLWLGVANALHLLWLLRTEPEYARRARDWLLRR